MLVLMLASVSEQEWPPEVKALNVFISLPVPNILLGLMLVSLLCPSRVAPQMCTGLWL